MTQPMLEMDEVHFTADSAAWFAIRENGSDALVGMVHHNAGSRVWWAYPMAVVDGGPRDIAEKSRHRTQRAAVQECIEAYNDFVEDGEPCDCGCGMAPPQYGTSTREAN